MYIEDLKQFPACHPPSPYNFPVQFQKDGRWGQGVLQDGLVLCAVGWLGNFTPSVGKTPSGCISRLLDAYQAGLLISDGTAGFHNCELCHGEDEWYPDGKVGPVIHWDDQRIRIYGHGHFLIHCNDTVYLSPALIPHYILDHWYKPPDVFIEAVHQGRFLSLENLEWVADENG